MGRHSSITDEIGDRILDLCEEGKTNQEMAEILGLTTRSIYRHCARSPEFRHAMRKAKDIADDIVESSLFQRANGYVSINVKQQWSEREQDFKAADEVIQHPPDTAAAKFWLNNRRPKEWREKSHVEHSGKDGGPIEFRTEEELDSAIREELKALGALIAGKNPETSES